VCSVTGKIVTGKAVGTCTIAANQAGNTTYNKALQVTKAIAIGKGAQVITFGTMPANLAIGGVSNIPATSTSALPLSFSSATTGICVVTGSTFKGIAAGTCAINANQAGNASYNKALQATKNITIGKIAQTLAFGAVPVITVGKTGVVTATATSALAVTFASSTPTICSVTGRTVRGIAAGICTIKANQAGNATYNAAVVKTQSFAIGKNAQTLTFGVAPVITVGKTKDVTATATSALAVTFASSTPTICTVTVRTVKGIAAGTCTIKASQTGNATYNAAAVKTQSFTIRIR
jgi:hypothetical protein